MPEEAEEIHVIGINKGYSDGKGLIADIRKRAASFKGKTVLFVLPEAVFGEIVQDRLESKSVAKELHKVLAEHGSAYAFFSINEWGRRGSGKYVLNTGYMVLPKKEGGIGYKAYPKLTTYKKGGRRSDYEDTVAEWAGLGKEERKENAGVAFKIGKKIKKFPETEINGTKLKVRMAVCSDARSKQPDEDELAKDSKRASRPRKSDIYIIPAKYTGITSKDVAHIQKNLRENGVAVVLDGGRIKRMGVIYRDRRFIHLVKTGRKHELQIAEGPGNRKIIIKHVKGRK